MDELNCLFASDRESSMTQGCDRAPLSYVVGILASVRRLEPLGFFFDAVPVDSGMAFDIGQHSSGSVTNLTCEMLSKHTEIPVHDAVDDVAVQRESVYLIPSHTDMIMEAGRLLQIDSDAREKWTPPVDNFIRSLAEDVGEQAFGMLRSETLRYGSQGVLAVGTAAGVVIALDETMQRDGMPRAPVEIGFADRMVPPSRIGEALRIGVNRRSELGLADHRHDDSAWSAEIVRVQSNGDQGRGTSKSADTLLARELEELCLICPRERALVAANTQLAAVLDAATQMSMCATDVDGTITVFNSGAEQMLGYQSSEMVGKATPAIIHLETEVEERGKELSRELGREVHGFEVFVAYAKAGRFERREWTYVRKDGRHLTVSLVVTAVRNAAGEITGFLGVAEDISERKRSEEALRKSEERFDLAVAGSNDGLWDWDVRTNEVYYSPRFKELLGYGDAEFENTFASFETHLHPDDRERTLAAVRRHLEDREAYDVEYRLRTKCWRISLVPRPRASGLGRCRSGGPHGGLAD